MRARFSFAPAIGGVIPEQGAGAARDGGEAQGGRSLLALAQSFATWTRAVTRRSADTRAVLSDQLDAYLDLMASLDSAKRGTSEQHLQTGDKSVAAPRQSQVG